LVIRVIRGCFWLALSESQRNGRTRESRGVYSLRMKSIHLQAGWKTDAAFLLIVCP
jgi:hypothetical protein